MECIFNISDYANSKKYIKIRYIIYVNNKQNKIYNIC